MRSGFKTFLLQISTIQQNIFGLRPTAKHTKITWVVSSYFYANNELIFLYQYFNHQLEFLAKFKWSGSEIKRSLFPIKQRASRFSD